MIQSQLLPKISAGLAVAMWTFTEAAFICHLAAGQESLRTFEVLLEAPDEVGVYAKADREQAVLGNAWLELRVVAQPDGIRITRLSGRRGGGEYSLVDSSPLAILLSGEGQGRGLLPLRPAGDLRVESFAGTSNALRKAERRGGKCLTLPIVLADVGVEGEVRFQLREGVHYVRTEIELTPASRVPLPADVVWWELPEEQAKPAGVVDGSPLVADGFFFFCEHPMAQIVSQGGKIRQISPLFPLPEEASALVRSAVIGVLIPGQKRRSFQAYLEQERPRPYRTFVNYNSWWDIAWGDRKMNEGQCLEVIRAFGEELIRKRGTAVDAFVFDDGWDDNRTLWGFHTGFPRGFSPLRELAQKYSSGVGTWLSPFGGYGQAREERLAYGKKEGFETNERGFSLAGPRYYTRFRDVCLRMLKEYDIRYFKFDGIAEGSEVKGASRRFGPDIEALLHLARQLREAKPDIFLSITTGTWPSPAWLLFGDSVWRGGHDWAAHGEGPVRQQWITYRDMEVYRRIVRRAPFYPLNSLMTVTICFGQLGTALKMGREAEDVIDEIWMAAASGTQNFELYLTPGLMSDRTWQALAEALGWIRANQPVLLDVHWYGGDPGSGEVYAYAAWSPDKAILALRNPATKPQEFTVRFEEAWQLPAEWTRRSWRVNARYCSRPMEVPSIWRADQTLTITVPPLTAVVLEACPISDE
ncbi:MAG: hypothetical protein NZ899_03410 [Thermoguttaceae bacterium]|nr:hypothetical protein [Thermoguttaceae bacterium]MDW8078836.1 hypothetical protein [Thermoguttaceae bacterium]